MRHRLCVCGAVREDRQGSVCPKCKAGEKYKSRNTTEHGYDGAWKRLSVRVRTEQPLCEVCLQRDIVTPATEVHHKVSIDEAPWLRLERENLMSVCDECHKAIHGGKELVNG